MNTAQKLVRLAGPPADQSGSEGAALGRHFNAISHLLVPGRMTRIMP
jgi:hypothetical protein